MATSTKTNRMCRVDDYTVNTSDTIAKAPHHHHENIIPTTIIPNNNQLEKAMKEYLERGWVPFYFAGFNKSKDGKKGNPLGLPEEHQNITKDNMSLYQKIKYPITYNKSKKTFNFTAKGICLNMGVSSNLMCIDFDKESEYHLYGNLLDMHPEIADFYTQTTRGGFHIFFKYNAKLYEIKKPAHIDLKYFGFVYAAPSFYQIGDEIFTYTHNNGIIGECPDYIYTYLASLSSESTTTNRSAKKKKTKVERTTSIPPPPPPVSNENVSAKVRFEQKNKNSKPFIQCPPDRTTRLKWFDAIKDCYSVPSVAGDDTGLNQRETYISFLLHVRNTFDIEQTPQDDAWSIAEYICSKSNKWNKSGDNIVPNKEKTTFMTLNPKYEHDNHFFKLLEMAREHNENLFYELLPESIGEKYDFVRDFHEARDVLVKRLSDRAVYSRKILFFKQGYFWISDIKEIEKIMLSYCFDSNLKILSVINIKPDKKDNSGDGTTTAKTTAKTKTIVENFVETFKDANELSKLVISKLVTNHDESFYEKFNTSTVGKICFQNGVLNWRTRVFTSWKDCNDVYTEIYIPYDYYLIEANESNNNLKAKVKAELFEAVLGEETDDFLLNISKALGSDFISKLWNLIQGLRNSGKTQIMKALLKTFGKYVGVTDCANFYLNKRKGEDIARNNAWKVHMIHHRITFVSEARDGLEKEKIIIDGVEIKSIASGGDRHVGRVLYQQQFEFELQTNLFFLNNHFPSVSPEDTNQFRKSYTTKHVFVGDDLDDEEVKNDYSATELAMMKRANTNLDELIATTYRPFIIQILLEAYSATKRVVPNYVMEDKKVLAVFYKELVEKHYKRGDEEDIISVSDAKASLMPLMPNASWNLVKHHIIFGIGAVEKHSGSSRFFKYLKRKDNIVPETKE